MAIKLRHYSPNTLKIYRSWARKFQTFLKSKEIGLINQEDTKEFLTYLAVETKVTSSTQNQAFNALLFLYRYILKVPFEEMQTVPRAKYTPYIPVVLSRTEVNAVFEQLSPHLLKQP